MAFFSFDSTTVERDTSRELIPAATYAARIIESAKKPLKSGNGDALSLTFEILDGPYAKRRVWASLNVVHNNPTAQSIAQQQLKAICDAIKCHSFTESTLHLLHNKPLKIRVKIRKDDAYGDKNEIGGYEAMTGATPYSAPQPAPAAANSAPAKPSAPWAKAA